MYVGASATEVLPSPKFHKWLTTDFDDLFLMLMVCGLHPVGSNEKSTFTFGKVIIGFTMVSRQPYSDLVTNPTLNVIGASVSFRYSML